MAGWSCSLPIWCRLEWEYSIKVCYYSSLVWLCIIICLCTTAAKEKAIFQAAIDDIANKTCIKIKKRTCQKDYISVQKSGGFVNISKNKFIIYIINYFLIEDAGLTLDVPGERNPCHWVMAVGQRGLYSTNFYTHSASSTNRVVQIATNTLRLIGPILILVMNHLIMHQF